MIRFGPKTCGTKALGRLQPRYPIYHANNLRKYAGWLSIEGFYMVLLGESYQTVVLFFCNVISVQVFILPKCDRFRPTYPTEHTLC
jgi:hypothetical protein